MSIKIIDKNITSLKKDLTILMDKDKEIPKGEEYIPNNVLIDIKNIVSSRNMTNLFQNLKKSDFFKYFTYKDLSELHELSELLYSNIRKIKDRVDVEVFLKYGYNLDIEALRKKFHEKKLHKEFPNFKFKKLEQLYKNPPKTIETYYDENQKVIVDSYVYRKYLIGLIQMVFNHMDLLICAVGAEGSGKSTKISQDMLVIHWTLRELGIIDYDFEIKELWFNSLSKFREAEDKYFKQHFRILGLDEGNELNRQDWKDEEVKTFFQRLRRERYNRRIKFICLPVLGELITNIILSRMNFITNMLNKNELTTGTLYKGEYEFYIIPRGSKIYSPFHKKEISRTEIKSKLYINLKDKEYLKGMPSDILIKKCKCNGVWGFKESEYISELKDTNKTFSVTKGITFGLTELFMFYKSHVTLKKMGIKKDDIRYASLAKMVNRINQFFYNDPDTMIKYEAMFQKKISDKEEIKNE